MNDSTQYQQAYEEWSVRIGSARAQANNWRWAFLLSLLALVLLLICLIMVVSNEKQYVYVAEIKPNASIVNLRSVDQPYQPSVANTEYMLGRFITAVMSLPLDPVIVRQNWVFAYSLVGGAAQQQLTNYAQSANPLSQLGQVTRTVEVRSIHASSNNSYTVSWVVTEYDQQGKIISSDLYSGSFTVAQGGAPQNIQQLLSNPFGVQIIYFSFDNQGE